MLDSGAWVQAKREGLGLTQRAFAELLGMPEAGERTVRGWELGEHFPTPAKRAQIENLPDTAALEGSVIPFKSLADTAFSHPSGTSFPRKHMPPILAKYPMATSLKLQPVTSPNTMSCWQAFLVRRFHKLA